MTTLGQAVEAAAHIPNAELHARGIRFCPGCQATRHYERSVGVVVHPEALTAALVAFIDAHEAARKAWMENPGAESPHLERYIRSAIEAATPIMLSHERPQTADAHRDAMVNRETKREELAAAWERGVEDGYHHRPNPYKEKK